MAGPDPKDPPVVRDRVLLKNLHAEWRECALCSKHRGKLGLHHISKHPKDDVRGNLVMLCGDGVSGCHGLIEAAHRPTRRLLGWYILNERDDVLPYLTSRHKGDEGRARAWISRVYHVE